MEIVRVILVDKKKRIRNVVLWYGVLTPLAFFFFFSIAPIKGENMTLLEGFFKVSHFWKYIGLPGFVLVVYLLFNTEKLLPIKAGYIMLSAEKIIIEKKKIYQEFSVINLKGIKLLIAMPSDKNEGNFFSTSALYFDHNNKKYEFEFNIPSKVISNKLTPIIKFWIETYPELKYEYR